jgi:DsbC/DsbD-like thiol-disulfide interchange protein
MFIAGGLRRWAAGCAVISALGGLIVAASADVSRWQGDERSAIRLIAGSHTTAGTLPGGIEMRLKPGWHTYWRYPGDAGVPPVFDFNGSRNLKQASVLWPAPQRIAEVGGTTIGYRGSVIFPLDVVPLDRAKPVMLRLKLDYAICERLCIPVESRSEIALPGNSRTQDSALDAARARVPKRQPPAADALLSIRSVHHVQASGRPRVLVDVAAPAGVPVDLFVEGPTAQWALPVPAPVGGAPAGLHRFAFELDGAPPGATYEGVVITLTAVTPLQAIEVATRLD